MEPWKLKKLLGGSVTGMLDNCNGAGTGPQIPNARSSMLTAIQNGLVSPRTAERLPFASHTQPDRP